MVKWWKRLPRIVAEDKKAARKEREAMAMQVTEARENEAAAGNSAQQGTTPRQPHFGAMRIAKKR